MRADVLRPQAHDAPPMQLAPPLFPAYIGEAHNTSADALAEAVVAAGGGGVQSMFGRSGENSARGRVRILPRNHARAHVLAAESVGRWK